MAKSPEGYDNSFNSDQLSFTFSDPEPDGDKIDVSLDGATVAEDLELTEDGTTVDLPPLATGSNQLVVTSKNAGTISTNNQVQVDVPEDNNLYGDSSYTFTLEQGQSDSIEIGLPKLEIDGGEAPFVAQNIADTLAEPVKLTIDRSGRGKRRRNITSAYTEEFGLAPNEFDRDEVPPAIGKDAEGRLPQNVRAIPALDNKRGGGELTDFTQNYGSENKPLENGTVIDFYASNPDYETGVSGIIPIYGTDGSDNELSGSDGNDDLIYGFDGNDTISGDNPDTPIERSGNDTLLGGRGFDRIRGRGGNDIVVGQPDDDLLFGDLGNDVVYGSPGNDVLYGDNTNVLSQPLNGKDRFVLRRNEGIDLIRDFELGNDEIVLGDPTNFSTLGFRQITNGVRPDGTPLELPDYPSLGSSDSISDSGTEIFLNRGKFKGDTLAYVENISESNLNDRSVFDTTGKILLPSPIV